MNLRQPIYIFLAIVLIITLPICPTLANSNQLLSPSAMQEDLHYLEEQVKGIHPDPYNSISRKEWKAKWADLHHRVESPMTLGDFYFTILEGLYQLRDAHTTSYFSHELFRLPVHFLWLEEGLVVANDFQEIQRGDRVLEMGGQTPGEILRRLEELVPAENQHWVKYFGGELHLHNRLWLKHLGLVNSNRQVQLKLQDSEGEVRTVALDFQRQENTSTPPYNYQFYPDQNLALLKLNICNNDRQYQELLAEFFAQVRADEITRIAIDLRENIGGQSSVVDELLTYTNVEKYKTYDIYRHQTDAPRWVEKMNRGLKKIIGKLFDTTSDVVVDHQDVVDLYDGELFVLNSKVTFSAGIWFGVIFQDNQIGTVVGEPTGNAPTHFGDTRSISLPNSNLRVSISQISWLRPDRTQNDADTLYPDVYIPLTREDLRQDRDPVLQWLLKNNQ